MTFKRKEQIGECTLYLGDCMDVMPTLGRVDAVVTDPPYGIGEAAGKNKSRGKLAKATDYGDKSWDDKPPPKEAFKTVQDISTSQIIFGGNYYPLPPTDCWLVWDKVNGKNDFADCELAWTNLKKAVRKIEWMWNGMLRRGDDVRKHPTQKPVGVMKWCLEQLPEKAETVLDPFMGSGTTGVACAEMDKQFIGIELDEEYFDIACKRIDDAYKQGRLF